MAGLPLEGAGPPMAVRRVASPSSSRRRWGSRPLRARGRPSDELAGRTLQHPKPWGTALPTPTSLSAPRSSRRATARSASAASRAASCGTRPASCRSSSTRHPHPLRRPADVPRARLLRRDAQRSGLCDARRMRSIGGGLRGVRGALLELRRRPAPRRCGFRLLRRPGGHHLLRHRDRQRAEPIRDRRGEFDGGRNDGDQSDHHRIREAGEPSPGVR